MDDFDDIEIEFTDTPQQEVAPAPVVQPTAQTQTPNSFLNYLAAENDSEYQRMFDFALDTLEFANKVQVFHWTCGKGFYHTQFNELYDLLRNFADTLVETTLSYSKDKFTFIPKNYSYQPMGFNVENAIAKLEEYRKAAQDVSKSLEMNRSLTNIFDDMLAELDKHIGLIKNFE